MYQEVKETKLMGVLEITPQTFDDARGFFKEVYRQDQWDELGLPAFVQYNHSRSTYGVLRGLHFQAQQPQGKLVQVFNGSIFDVALDLRSDSPTFGQWFGLELSDKNHKQLYIPPGFAHGFLTLSKTADVHYLCTDYYLAGDDHGLLWNDPTVNISWPTVAGEYLLSDKDKKWGGLESALEILKNL